MEPLGPCLGAFGDRGQAYAGELIGLEVWVLRGLLLRSFQGMSLFVVRTPKVYEPVNTDLKSLNPKRDKP